MKDRILKALAELSTSDKPISNEFEGLTQSLNMTEDELRLQSKKLLGLILHRYDDFAISTIDAFVHRIIRTFALDVKLPQNFEVVIDQDDIIPDIIEDLYKKVGHDDSLTNIMLNYVLSTIEDEGAYDPTRKLYDFVSQQLKEDGFDFVRQLESLTMDDFLRIISRIRSNAAAIKSAIQKTSKDALELIAGQHLEPSDLYYGARGIYGYFVKSSTLVKDDHFQGNSNVNKTIEEGIWYTKKIDSATKTSIDSIKDKLLAAFNSIQTYIPHYFLFKLLYAKIYAVALTKEIADLFQQHTEENQSVHISEFNKRISNEISGQPVPFIYERLGRKYSHFLIDEFQDTSILQWNNLLPLIEESLSVGNFNMLVGDAKQAIYRFRNGEVGLFTQLPKLYQTEISPESMQRESLLKEHYREVNLDTNYRSMKEVVDFNNLFFEFLKKDNQGIQDIFKGHQQLVEEKEEKKGGYVAMDLIYSEKVADYANLRMQHFESSIELLLKQGYSQSDICVLSRTNKNTAEVAAYLLGKGYQVVSSESLLLQNAPYVRLIIDFLTLVLTPNDRVVQASFVQNLIYSEIIKGPFHHAFKAVDKGLKSKAAEYYNFEGFYTLIQGFTVYEMAEFAIRYLLRDPKPNVYLQFFLDFVFEYQQQGKASLEGFLKRWEDKKDKLFISMPEGEEAIQVMTVHKAKGLKFEAVIVDIAQTTTLKGKNIFWTPIHNEDLKGLKVSQLPLSGELAFLNKIDILEEEQNKRLIDFINLVYVAFTRAVSSLIITGRLGGGRGGDLYGKFLQDFLIDQHLWEDDKQHYEWGSLSDLNLKKSDGKNKSVEIKSFASTNWQELVKLAPSDEVYWEMIDSKPARTYGKLIHQMLSRIITATEVSKVVNESHLAGQIDREESKTIQQLLADVVEHPKLASLFTQEVIVKNETEVIDAKGKSHRPDRVVIQNDTLTIIDYKTGDRDVSHNKQVKDYAQLFAELGYSKIKLLLVYLNQKVEVLEVTVD